MTAEKPRILLVDDEPSVVKMVGKRLEFEGFEVVIAVDGQDAWDKATTQTPNLIILDLMLPKLNGFEVCSRLKQDERYRQIPIVIFTGKGKEVDEQRCRDCGADAYVTKGDGKAVLMQKVKELLSQR